MLTMKRFLIGFGILLLAVAGVAAYTSMQYWGYLFAPPPVENVLAPMTTLENYRYVFLSYGAEGYLHLSPHNLEQNYRPELEQRVQRFIASQNIEADTNFDMESLSWASMLIEASDWQLFPEESRELCSPWCHPVAFVLTGYAEDGTPLIFINASSTNAVYGKDDHYHYYEGLFEFQDGQYELIKEQRFQYDIAGIEGLTFPFIYVAFLIVASAGLILLAIPISAIYYLYQKLGSPKQKRKSHLIQ